MLAAAGRAGLCLTAPGEQSRLQLLTLWAPCGECLQPRKGRVVPGSLSAQESCNCQLLGHHVGGPVT